MFDLGGTKLRTARQYFAAIATLAEAGEPTERILIGWLRDPSDGLVWTLFGRCAGKGVQVAWAAVAEELWDTEWEVAMLAAADCAFDAIDDP